MRQNLLLLSAAILLLSACSLPQKRHWKPIEKRVVDIEELPPLFSNPGDKGLYKGSFQYKDQFFGGLFFIKCTAPQHHRLVLMSEIGLKLMDFEVKPNEFVLHHCPTPFQRKAMLKLLEQDFRLLLLNPLTEQSAKIFKDTDNAQRIYRLRVGDSKGYFGFENARDYLRYIETATALPYKMKAELSSYHNGIPQKIVIQHPRIGLRIDLEWVERGEKESGER